MTEESKKSILLENKIKDLLNEHIQEFEIEYIELFLVKKQGKFPDKVIKIEKVNIKTQEEE